MDGGSPPGTVQDAGFKEKSTGDDARSVDKLGGGDIVKSSRGHCDHLDKQLPKKQTNTIGDKNDVRIFFRIMYIMIGHELDKHF